MFLKVENKIISLGGGLLNIKESYNIPDEPITPEVPDTPEPEVPDTPEPETNIRSGYTFDSVHKIEDIYSTVQPNERIIIITRHAARGSDTSITGDLSSTGIQQCKTIGEKLSNNNIDLTKSYIGGSVKYRAKNTAYQATKAMGVVYPDGYDYIADTDSYSELLETYLFMDSDGESSGIGMELNAYYSYVNESGYTGANKVPNHVNTKCQEIIDFLVNKAKEKDADLCWFGTHDKIIQPLTAYVTNRKNPIHIDRTNKDGYIKMNPLPYSGYVGNWSTPLLSGLAIIVNKTTDEIEIYPVESGF